MLLYYKVRLLWGNGKHWVSPRLRVLILLGKLRRTSQRREDFPEEVGLDT